MQGKYTSRSHRSLVLTVAQVSFVLILVGVLVTARTQVIIARWDGGTGTGPGGVGATDGSSDLELWLVGDEGVYTDTSCTSDAANGNSIACWADQSGNANDVTQSTSGDRPTYVTSAFNGSAAPDFDGSDDYLQGNPTDTDTAFTIFVVVNREGTSEEYFSHFASTDDYSLDGAFQLDTASDGVTYRFFGNDDGTQEFFANGTADSNPSILTYYFDSSTIYAYHNSSSPTPSSLSFGSTPNFDVFAVGQNRNNNVSWPGKIAEIALYYESLNSAERILVENYLSAKYNIDISGSGNDRYAGDTSGNGDYDIDVAGIGRESDGTNLEAHSAGIVVTDTATSGFLRDNGDYVVVGHDEPDFGITDQDLDNVSANERWARVWYLDKTEGGTGNSDNISIAFDFSEAGGDPVGDPDENAASNYYLLQRNGTSGDFSEVTVQNRSVVGDRVIFEVADTDLDDGWYYTLGADNEPLNVSLSRFEAEHQGDDVAVEWTTTLEINTWGFNLWRSTAENGDYVQVNDTLIPTEFPGSTQGGSYALVDKDVTPDTPYFYKLEELETGGVHNWYGPTATQQETGGGTGPTALTLSTFTAEDDLPAWGLLILGAGVVAVGIARRRRRS